MFTVYTKSPMYCTVLSSSKEYYQYKEYFKNEQFVIHIEISVSVGYIFYALVHLEKCTLSILIQLNIVFRPLLYTHITVCIHSHTNINTEYQHTD